MLSIPKVCTLAAAIQRMTDCAVSKGYWVPRKGVERHGHAGKNQCVLDIHILPATHRSKSLETEGLVDVSFTSADFVRALDAFAKSPSYSKCSVSHKEYIQYMYRNMVMYNKKNSEIKVFSVTHPDAIFVNDAVLATLVSKQRQTYLGFPSKSEIHDERIIRKMTFELPKYANTNADVKKRESLCLCFEDYDNAFGDRVFRIYFTLLLQESTVNPSEVASAITRACRAMGVDMNLGAAIPS